MPAEGWLFPTGLAGHPTAQYVGLLVADALPGHWMMQSLRHRFGSRAYRGTRNLHAVRALLGLASIAGPDEGTEPSTIARRIGVGYKTVARIAETTNRLQRAGMPFC